MFTPEKSTQRRKEIGNYYRNIREECGLTQQQLADKVGVAYNTISGFENGRYWIGLKHFVLIKEALGLTEV